MCVYVYVRNVVPSTAGDGCAACANSSGHVAHPSAPSLGGGGGAPVCFQNGFFDVPVSRSLEAAPLRDCEAAGSALPRPPPPSLFLSTSSFAGGALARGVARVPTCPPAIRGPCSLYQRWRRLAARGPGTWCSRCACNRVSIAPSHSNVRRGGGISATYTPRMGWGGERRHACLQWIYGGGSCLSRGQCVTLEHNDNGS